MACDRYDSARKEELMLQKDKPLWMPDGSVRSILALGVVGAYVAGAVPIEVATLVLGFYFGQRGGSS